MSINASHANGAILIHAGEYILLHHDNACIRFTENDSQVFKGHKYGHIYLTSHRIIFRTKRQTDMLLSFSAPFVSMQEVELLPDNYIQARLIAQPYGNFIGSVKFTIHFKTGGAVEFMNALRYAAAIAIDKWTRRFKHIDELPPHLQARACFEVAEEVYQPPEAVKNWLPVSSVFTSLKPNSVFMTEHPPPYPGIGKTKECKKCDPFKKRGEHEKFPTPKHSFDGFGQPPVYGVFTSSHPDRVFPHQAAFPPCDFSHSSEILEMEPVRDEGPACLEPKEQNP